MIKDKLKQIIPSPIWNQLRRVVNNYLGLRQAAVKQAKRFEKYYSKPNGKGEKQVEARLIFFTHQIEKGLSHLNFRYGFGHKALSDLANIMQVYRTVNPSYKESQSYKSALAALNEYVSRHQGHEDNIAYVKQLFDGNAWPEILNESSRCGGSIILSPESKAHNSSLTFCELSENRHSVREYSSQPVTYDELLKAIKIAMRTPSVCNRQPTRIHVILDKDLIKKALSVQGGFNGYPLPPALLLITADNRVFLSPQERNEGCTDGGLFGMSLLLALEEESLAACPLNTMMRRGSEAQTRNMLNLPEYENLVMYIAVGHYPGVIKTCVSHRYDAEDIVTVH